MLRVLLSLSLFHVKAFHIRTSLFLFYRVFKYHSTYRFVTRIEGFPGFRPEFTSREIDSEMFRSFNRIRKKVYFVFQIWIHGIGKGVSSLKSDLIDGGSFRDGL